MFKKPYRLKHRGLFAKTLSSGLTISSCPYFTLLALPRAYPSNKPAQFGIIVSKKVSNRANKRNKVKRRLRELLRTVLIEQAGDTLTPYIALICIARSASLNASYSQLHQALLSTYKPFKAGRAYGRARQTNSHG